MEIAYIGLGSNLGKRQAALRAAIGEIRQLPRSRVIALANFRETDPVDSPVGAAKFINTVLQLETDLPATELLTLLLEIERKLGRARGTGDATNAPRTIDLDLLMYGAAVMDMPGLTLPHPRMAARRFVLEPLAEIAPNALHPPSGQTIRALLEALGTEWKSAKEKFR